MQIQPPPEKFLSTLLEIRNYYAPLVDKYGKLYREALDNLNHVQALLSNLSLQEEGNSDSSAGVAEEILTLPTQNGTHPQAKRTESELIAFNNTELTKVNNITTKSTTSQNQVTLVRENLSNGSSLDISPNENESDEAANALKLPAINAEVTAIQESEFKDDTSDTQEATTELTQPGTDEPSPPENEVPIVELNSKEETSTKPNKSLLKQDIPMLGEYQFLSRIEAVQKLLEQYKGSVYHIDFVVRSLYGDLEPKAWKVVKGRVQSTLTQGRESGKWSLVPGKPGYYTIDLKLLNSPRKDSSSKKSQTKNEKSQVQANISPNISTAPSSPKNKKPDPQAKANVVPLKGKFEGKFLIDAITSLLQQNPRKIFDSGEVIYQLYGELQPEQIKQVKSSVLNELSRGFRTGRFSRVPEEKGLYIWDAKLLPD